MSYKFSHFEPDQPLTMPTVHLNGTGRKALSEQYETAYRAVNDALVVLREAAPNARDYYVQDGNAFARAAEQHSARVKRLQTVCDELLAIYEHVQG